MYSPDTRLWVGQSGQYFSGPVFKLLLLVGPQDLQEVITETHEGAKGRQVWEQCLRDTNGVLHLAGRPEEQPSRPMDFRKVKGVR